MEFDSCKDNEDLNELIFLSELLEDIKAPVQRSSKLFLRLCDSLTKMYATKSILDVAVYEKSIKTISRYFDLFPDFINYFVYPHLETIFGLATRNLSLVEEISNLASIFVKICKKRHYFYTFTEMTNIFALLVELGSFSIDQNKKILPGIVKTISEYCELYQLVLGREDKFFAFTQYITFLHMKYIYFIVCLKHSPDSNIEIPSSLMSLLKKIILILFQTFQNSDTKGLIQISEERLPSFGVFSKSKTLLCERFVDFVSLNISSYSSSNLKFTTTLRKWTDYQPHLILMILDCISDIPECCKCYEQEWVNVIVYLMTTFQPDQIQFLIKASSLLKERNIIKIFIKPLYNNRIQGLFDNIFERLLKSFATYPTLILTFFSDFILFFYRFIYPRLDIFFNQLISFNSEGIETFFDVFVREFDENNNVLWLVSYLGAQSTPDFKSNALNYLCFRISKCLSKSQDLISSTLSIAETANSKYHILRMIYCSLLSYKFVKHEYFVHSEEKAFITRLIFALLELFQTLTEKSDRLTVSTIVNIIIMYYHNIVDMDAEIDSFLIPMQMNYELNDFPDNILNQFIYLQHAYFSVCISKMYSNISTHNNLLIFGIYDICYKHSDSICDHSWRISEKPFRAQSCCLKYFAIDIFIEYIKELSFSNQNSDAFKKCFLLVLYKLSNLNRRELFEKYKVACQYSQSDDWNVSVHFIAERTISKILKNLINKYEIKSHIKTHLVSDISTISDLILKNAQPIETNFDFLFIRLIVKTLVWTDNLSDKNIVTQIILANLCIYVSLLNIVPNEKVVKTSIKLLMKIIEFKSTNLEENFRKIIGLNILKLILSSVSWDKMNQIIIKSLKGLVKKLISTEIIDIYTEFPTEMLTPSNFFFFVLFLFQHVKYHISKNTLLSQTHLIESNSSYLIQYFKNDPITYKYSIKISCILYTVYDNVFQDILSDAVLLCNTNQSDRNLNILHICYKSIISYPFMLAKWDQTQVIEFCRNFSRHVDEDSNYSDRIGNFFKNSTEKNSFIMVKSILKAIKSNFSCQRENAKNALLLKFLLAYLKTKKTAEKSVRLIDKFIETFYENFTDSNDFLPLVQQAIVKSSKYRLIRFDSILTISHFYSSRIESNEILIQLIALMKQMLFSFSSSFYKNAHVVKTIWLNMLQSLGNSDPPTIDKFFLFNDHLTSHQNFAKHAWIFVHHYLTFLQTLKQVNKTIFKPGLFPLLKALRNNQSKLCAFLGDDELQNFDQIQEEYKIFYKFKGT